MIGTQLDLFGGPPKPPKKITMDEEPESTKPETVEDLSGSTVPEDLKASDSMVHIEMPFADSSRVFSLAEDKEDEIGLLAHNESFEPLPLEIETISLEPTEIEVFHDLNANTLEGVAELESDSDIWIDNREDEHLEVNPIEPSLEWAKPADEIVNSLEEEGIESDGMKEADGDEEVQIRSLVSQETTENFDDVLEFEGEELVVAHPGKESASSMQDETLSIPNDTQLYSRQYYTMRETAAMFHVNQSLIRFWENEFDILKPKKNRKGDRYFRPDDIKNLQLIYHLLKVKKFTINGAKEHLKSNAKLLTTFEMVQQLEKLKSFLVELKTNL